ncbi:MAG: hypothetical protein HC925_02350 [Coleofasciculaceae cyanobacterium SM2_3_26]|nr:hypothetical protein [Coleofasciculaceae cyanobacterium SM2_3_26]
MVDPMFAPECPRCGTHCIVKEGSSYRCLKCRFHEDFSSGGNLIGFLAPLVTVLAILSIL